MKKLLLALLLLTQVWAVQADFNRNVAEYNLNTTNGVGLIHGADKATAPGFDPVAVFSGESLMGNPSISLEHEGVKYLFASEENRDEFLNAPKKYEPTYGGYCARAMVAGQKVHINTSLFTIVGDRSFFFVSSRAKRFFDRNLQENIRLADEMWENISGELPRK